MGGGDVPHPVGTVAEQRDPRERESAPQAAASTVGSDEHAREIPPVGGATATLGRRCEVGGRGVGGHLAVALGDEHELVRPRPSPLQDPTPRGGRAALPLRGDRCAGVEVRGTGGPDDGGGLLAVVVGVERGEQGHPVTVRRGGGPSIAVEVGERPAPAATGDR